MAIVRAVDLPVRVPLTIRVERAKLADEETGLRIQAWSSVSHVDAGSMAQADITDLEAAKSGPEEGNPTYTLTLQFPRSRGEGTAVNPWPADAYVWFSADIFAPSADGPLVGSRGGRTFISLRDLRDRVVAKGSSVARKLMMTQSGLPRPLHKMNVRVLEVDDSAIDIVRNWVFAESIEHEDFVAPLMEHHDQMLENYVRKLMFPFTDEAFSRGVGFPASTTEISTLHAPIWDANVQVPQWAFWMQTGDRIVGEQMRQLKLSLRTAFDIVLARHDWQGGLASFVSLVVKQTVDLYSDTYNPLYTFACAVMCDVCALYATQLYYRYDEAFEIVEYWFKADTSERKSIESFHDALSMKGGDCEDLGALIHRIFRWIQLGDERLAPAKLDTSNYYQTYGGWDDMALDALQRMTYWYVSCGSVGSVTSARVPSGAGGQKRKLIINSELDESLPIGGHMWNVMIPVSKMEDLVQRMNPTTVKRGNLRPKFPLDAYPRWLQFLPTLSGEGTGALYPLIMPWQTYMHTEEGRLLATERHEKRLEAVQLIQKSTKAMRLLQVQRVSDRVTPDADRRANDFYRRGTALYTDDMALHGIPHFGFIWTQTAPRQPEGTMSVGSVPGEGRPGNSPTWGVNVRDAIFAANNGAYGDGKPNVALTLQPSITNGEMASFKSRIKQLKPWAVPVITPSEKKEVKRTVGGYIGVFQESLDMWIPTDTPERDLDEATRINIVFRRDEFTIPNLRRAIIEDVKHLSDRIVKTSTTLEYPFDDGYSVCLSVWISPSEGAGASAGAMTQR